MDTGELSSWSRHDGSEEGGVSPTSEDHAPEETDMTSGTAFLFQEVLSVSFLGLEPMEATGNSLLEASFSCFPS